MDILERINSCFERHGAGDYEGALANFAPDVEFIEAGNNVRSGVHKGRDGVKSLWDRVFHEWTDGFDGDFLYMVGEGKHAFSLARAHGKRKGSDRTVDTFVITVYEANDDGLFQTVRDIPFDWVAWEAFWQPV